MRPRRRNRSGPRLLAATHRPVGVALLALFLSLASSSEALAAPGDLDPTFSRDGRVLTDFGGPLDHAEDVAVAPNGAIVVAGSTGDEDGTDVDIAIARYLSDGALDPSFSGDGRLTIDFGYNESAVGLAIQPDGRILIASPVSPSGANELTIVRLMSDGTTDASFSEDGIATTKVEGVAAVATGVELGPGGTIYGIGRAHEQGQHDVGVARFLSDGRLDSTFAGDGTVRTDIGPRDRPTDAVVDGDGRLVVLADPPLRVARYLPDGTPDPSFSDDGVETASCCSEFDATAGGVALQPDGGPVVAYFDVVFGIRGSFAVHEAARLTPGGQPDTAYAAGGVASVAGALDIATAPDGGAILVGEGSVERLTPAGMHDPAFGEAGTVRISGGNTVALQANGRIVVAGGREDFALARHLVDPGPPNLDADPMLDPKDRCDGVYGPKGRRGCPLVARSLTVRRRGRELRGTLTGAHEICTERKSLRVMQVDAGRDRIVERLSTQRDGEFDSKALPAPGRFYVVAPRRIEQEAGICARARSRPFEVADG
jgi:uncharacterized delta-60 repeat protein